MTECWDNRLVAPEGAPVSATFRFISSFDGRGHWCRTLLPQASPPESAHMFSQEKNKIKPDLQALNLASSQFQFEGKSHCI